MEKIIFFYKRIAKKIKESDFWSNLKIRIVLLLTLLLNLSLWVAVIIKSRSISIPFYNPVSSSTRYLLPENKEIFIIPIVATFILIANYYLAYKIFKQEKFLSSLFLAASLFIQILLIITFIFYLLV